MGTDIHIEAHKVHEDGNYDVLSVKPFDWQSYGMFGFLANVRNYACVPPIAERRGLPDWVKKNIERIDRGFGYDYPYNAFGDHSPSYLMLSELLNFDYDVYFENRRCMINGNGGSICEVGKGEMVTFREFLGEDFFKDLDKLKELNADAIVFGFDS